LNVKKLIFPFIAIYLIFSYSIYFLDIDTRTRLTEEDGLFESLGAGYFFIGAGIFFLLAFYFYPRAQNRRTASISRYFYTFLGVFLLLCFLEEISWGQRIFMVKTPVFFKAYNLQKETNIHNLIWWRRELVNPPSLFIIFSLIFCVAIPIANKISPAVRSLVEKVGLPLVPIPLALLFFINYLSVHSKFFVPGQRIIDFIEEIRESNFAFLFMWYAIFELSRSLGKNKLYHPEGQIS